MAEMPPLQIALGVLTVAIPLSWLLWGKVFKAFDRRWERKHPGRSRVPPSDAPIIPYETERAPEWIRGIDEQGRALPEPPRKRKLRDL